MISFVRILCWWKKNEQNLIFSFGWIFEIDINYSAFDLLLGPTDSLILVAAFEAALITGELTADTTLPEKEKFKNVDFYKLQ